MNGILSVEFTAEAATEPVTKDEVKTWLRLDPAYIGEDTTLDMLIKATRINMEKYLNLSLIDRTVKAWVVNQEGGVLLPYGPVPDVVTVEDADGNIVDPGNVQITGSDFKYLQLPISDSLTVQYTVTAAVSDTVKLGMLQAIAYAYEHRGEELNTSICKQAKATVSKERVRNDLMFF